METLPVLKQLVLIPIVRRWAVGVIGGCNRGLVTPRPPPFVTQTGVGVKGLMAACPSCMTPAPYPYSFFIT